MSNRTKALLASYGRSILGAVAALYLAGVTDPQEFLWALAAALAPVFLRYINPNDPAFGKVPELVVVEEALADVKPVKKAAKKPVAKKTTTNKTNTTKK